ncbi:UNVERIFIED_CONTAM: hypothetical protein FKN15_023200, partial [Acipenser sinensis]
KSFTAQTLDCELEECREFMALANRSGNPGMECCHLQRTVHSLPYSPPNQLCQHSLDSLLSKGLKSNFRKDECASMASQASIEGACAVYPLLYDAHGFFYFSVYTGKQDYWCRFGRTKVTFDTKTGHWYCQCKGSKKMSFCVHRYLSMWWIYQEKQEVLCETVSKSLAENEDTTSVDGSSIDVETCQ